MAIVGLPEVVVGGFNPNDLVVVRDGTETGTSNSTLLSFVDHGNSITGAALVTSATNTAFWGVAFTPTALPSATVPEPASVILVGLGLIAAGIASHRHRRTR